MPYRIEHPVPRRSFYGLLASGAVAGLAALGLTFATQVSNNAAVADHALLKAQSAQIASLKAQEAQAAAQQANERAQAARAVQVQATRAICLADNRHHNAAIHELYRQTRITIRHTRSPEVRRSIITGRKQAAVLITKLDPYQNCH